MKNCPKCGAPQVEEHTNYAKETGRTWWHHWWGCGTFQTRDCHPHYSDWCLEREEKNTLQRKVEEFAEDLCVERIAHANTIRKLDDKHKQVCELKRERNRLIDDLQASTIHSCGDSCSRPMCVLRRERDAYKEALEMIAYDPHNPPLDHAAVAAGTLAVFEEESK